MSTNPTQRLIIQSEQRCELTYAQLQNVLVKHIATCGFTPPDAMKLKVEAAGDGPSLKLFLKWETGEVSPGGQ